MRTRAKNCFLPLLKEALEAYLKDSHDQLPTDVAQLARFFPPPLDPAILQRYEMRATGLASGISEDTILIAEKSGTIDPRYDNLGQITPGYTAMTMDTAQSPFAEMPAAGKAATNNALAAYRAAHSGQEPETPDQLIPFLKNPEPELAGVFRRLTLAGNPFLFSNPQAHNDAVQLFRADHHGAYPNAPEELTLYFQDELDAAKYLIAVRDGRLKQ